MDKKTTGAWLIFQTGKLQRIEQQGSFENTFLAGKAGILLSAVSTDSTAAIDNEKLNVLAKASGINTKTELPILLELLEERGLIDKGQSGIEVLGVTTAATLQHTANMFDDSGPTNAERAALEISERASSRPQLASQLAEEISDEFEISSRETIDVIGDSEQIGFVDAEHIDEQNKLLFNGNLFRRDDTAKVAKVLDSLTDQENARVREFSEILTTRACVEVDEAERVLGKSLFTKLSSVGIYDISLVSNNREEVAYVTRPSAFSKFSNSLVEDAFDLAKVFVSSLTYGMTRSPHDRGHISMIEALLIALINGEEIGPVTAIGQDYKILEMKHVVQVFQGNKKGRAGFMMRLLKKDVGTLALEVIRNSDASQHSLEALPSAAVVNFRGPELNRERRRRRQLNNNPRATNDILLALRTGATF